MVDQTGVIQKANPRALDVLRMRESNLTRSKLDGFVSPLPIEKFAQNGTDDPFLAPPPIEGSLPSGEPVRVMLRAVLPGSGHMLLCLEGFTERERADRTEAALRALAQSVPFALLENDGTLRFASPALAALFALEDQQLTGISDATTWQSIGGRFRNPQAFALSREALSRGEISEYVDQLDMVHPARRLIERRVRPVFNTQQRIVGWLELYGDVTGERQSQAFLLQAEKMAALGHLVSGIAHELNNPLTTIMGYAQLLLGSGLSKSQLSEARNVYQEAERARRIVKNLLYFSRANQPERTRVELNDVVERALALRTYELRVENIAVICELATDLPPTMADPYQLQQVVLNLLVNAEQALIESRGSGHVYVRTSWIGVGENRRLLLEVADDGPGIPPEIGSQIFDPFFTTKPPGVGTGMGLSIVYGIIRQHGGEIRYESHPGTGTRFTIELPVLMVPTPEKATDAAAGELSRPAAVTSRILVVEDEPTVAQLLVDILTEEGHEVEATLDSQEGLTRLSRKKYGLVICDLRMPRLDGRAFYDALVRSGSPVRNRILFITGDTVARGTHEFLQATGVPHLPKPFLVEEVKLAVRHMLESHAGEAVGQRN